MILADRYYNFSTGGVNFLETKSIGEKKQASDELKLTIVYIQVSSNSVHTKLLKYLWKFLCHCLDGKEIRVSLRTTGEFF